MIRSFPHKLIAAVGAALLLGACDSPTQPGVLRLTAVEGPRSVQVDSPIELSVRVADDHGVPVTGTVTQWEILSGGGILSAGSEPTGEDGIATVAWTVGYETIEGRLRARVADLPPVLFVISIRPGDLASIELQPLSGAIAQVGGSFTFVPAARDAYGNALLLPPESFAWSSSEASVATVSNGGQAFAEGTGVTVITAELEGIEGAGILQVGAVDPELVVFASRRLEEVIRTAIGKPQGILYRADLDGLTELEAPGLGIRNLLGLEAADNLTRLNLRGNGITNLTPLSELSMLEVLNLGNNSISTLESLGTLVLMQELDLSENVIPEVGPLRHLLELSILDLSHNRIRHIDPLVENPGIDLGDEVHLESNLLTVKAVCQDIPALQGRGVLVTYHGNCPGVPASALSAPEN